MVRLAQDYAGQGAWGPVLLLALAGSGLLVFGGALAWRDAHSHLLPDRLVVLLALSVIPALALAALWAGEPGRASRALAAAAAAGGLFLALHLASPRSLGFGDVKLAPVLGFACGFLSWGHLALAGVAACLFSGVWAAVLLARGGRTAHVPLGPGLVLGVWLAYVV
ncbi:prepilin peptidase [Galactobacter valiniphilus]|uniref:prepilin peptidase n=1 Tax=Galactobacter valiniphilus TaxID=2676122 RepID=UPI00373694BA